MSPRTARSWLRWTHIALGLMLATWLYTPLVADPTAITTVRFLLVPFLAVSGLSLWGQVALSRLRSPLSAIALRCAANWRRRSADTSITFRVASI